MDLQPIVHSEVNKKEKDKYFILNACVWNLERWYWWTYFQGSTEMQTWRTDVWTQCGREKVGQMERVVTYNGMSLSFKKEYIWVSPNEFPSLLSAPEIIEFKETVSFREGFPTGSSGKESSCNAGDSGNGGQSLSWEDSSTGGNGNPLQLSCLENHMDRGAWWATVHGVVKSWTYLSMHAWPDLMTSIIAHFCNA